MVNQTMPNMPNYSASVPGTFPGLLGMIPGIVQGASGGVVLPGIGATLGEVCREYLNGRCVKTDCKFNHPPHNLLMTALTALTSMGTVSQVPMAPSAAAMAAAQAIVAAQALQAHAAHAQAQSVKDASGIYWVLIRFFAGMYDTENAISAVDKLYNIVFITENMYLSLHTSVNLVNFCILLYITCFLLCLLFFFSLLFYICCH